MQTETSKAEEDDWNAISSDSVSVKKTSHVQKLELFFPIKSQHW